jgi:His-Xaa-Ser system protein (TIGR03982 family)
MKSPFKWLLGTFCVLWIGKEVLAPATAAAVYSQDYMRLAMLCDTAMNSSWFIQQTDDPELRKTELIQMLDCHEYDKVRKIMLIFGLPENYLSYLGLRALEVHQRSAEEFVEQHRFTER